MHYGRRNHLREVANNKMLTVATNKQTNKMQIIKDSAPMLGDKVKAATASALGASVVAWPPHVVGVYAQAELR